jgi:hypothetical protein
MEHRMLDAMQNEQERMANQQSILREAAPPLELYEKLYQLLIARQIVNWKNRIDQKQKQV